jgi:hypothetical protein
LTAAHSYQDVAVDLRLTSGNLDLRRLRIADEQGPVVDLKGALEHVATRPKGSLSGLIAAPSPADLADLALMLGLPEAWRPHAELARALTPIRLAGSMLFGARTANSRDLSFAGEANGTTLKVSGRLDGAAGGWRSGPVELTATLDAADARKITALLSDRDPGGGKAAPGQVLIKAKGVPADGLSTVLTLAAADLAIDFHGLATPLAETPSLAGELRLKVADAAGVAGLLGLSPPLPLAGVPLDGDLSLAAGAAGIKLERLALNVAGSEVRGQMALKGVGDRRQIDARLELSEINVRSLVRPLLDERLAAVTGAAEAVLTGRQSPWPDEPFDLTALSGLDGHLVLTTQRLGLSDGIGLGDAKVEVTLAGGKVVVDAIEGRALGGRGRVQLSIASSGSGAEVAGALTINDGTLEALGSAPGGKAAAGRFTAELSFRGRGASPRALIAALAGQGRLKSDGKLSGLWPGAVSLAAGEVLKNEPDKLRGVLQQALGQGLAAGRLALPPEVVLELAEGQLRSQPIVIDNASGRAAGSAAVNLQTFQFESEWRLQQAPAAALGNKPPLPAVVVTYRGPLAVIDKIEPAVNTEALERELAVRKMEYDVEELERLRQLDEARRRSEDERLRQEMQSPPPTLPAPLPPGSPPRSATPG